MATKKYLDYNGLAYLWEKIKSLASTKQDKETGKGLSSNDYTSDDKAKLANVEVGAQVNVLEGIQKNGTTVTITNKIANIDIPTATSDLTNDSGFITSADIPEGAAASATVPSMDGTAAVGTETRFARGDHVHPTDTSRASASDVTTLTGRVDDLETNKASASDVTTLTGRVTDLETAVGTGGSVDTKISNAIGDLDSAITATANEAIASVTIVDGKISGSTKVTVPTNNNQLTNGAGYQTASDVATAISGKANSSTTLSGYGISDAYTKTEVDNAISSAITTVMDYKGTKATVADLPSTGNKNGDVWHVTANNGEYAWDGAAWQELGSTVDLSGYVQTSDLSSITNAEIDTIVAS